MKREFKQLIVVFALVIALVAVGCLVSGCGKKQPDPTQTTTDPVWTIPTSGDSTSSSETTKSSETTATNDTSTTASSTKPVVPPVRRIYKSSYRSSLQERCFRKASDSCHC